MTTTEVDVAFKEKVRTTGGHVVNIFTAIALFMFNYLLVLGFGMGEGEMPSGIWISAFISFLFCIFFYIVQFIRKSHIWRFTWFGIMIVCLFFWESGFGVSFVRMVIG